MALPLIGALAGAGAGLAGMYQQKADYTQQRNKYSRMKRLGKESLSRDTKDAASAIQVGQGIEGGSLAAERMADVQRPHLERLREIRKAKKHGRRAFGLGMLQNALKIGAGAASGMSGLGGGGMSQLDIDIAEARKLMG